MKHLALLIMYMLLNPSLVIADDELIVREAIKKIVLTGYSRNVKSQTVSSEISGKVSKVNYDVGDTIGINPFVEIDPTFINFEIKSTLQSLERTGVMIRKALSRVSYLEKESFRIRNLLKDEMATEADRDSIFQKLEQAQLELESAKKEKESLTITLNTLRERNNRHTIYAPQGWIVTERNVEENEIIQQGMSLAKVSDYRRLVVPLAVSNEELSAIESLPDFFNASIEGRPVKASVNWINPEFNEKTRKLNIELIIHNYQEKGRGGLKFTLPVSIKTEGMYIPREAVTIRYENHTVTLKESGEIIQLLVLGEYGDNLLVAEDSRLVPGTRLYPASSKR